MVEKERGASKAEAKKIMAVLKKKTAQLKRKTKEEAVLKKTLTAAVKGSNAKMGTRPKEKVTDSKIAKKKVTKKQMGGHHSLR